MITAQVYRGAASGERLDPDEAMALVGAEGTFVWLDAADPQPADVERLGGAFGFHPVSLEDAVRGHQRSKVEIFDRYTFVVLHAVEMDRDALQGQEIHAFIGDGYLVTLRFPPAFAMDEVVRRWERQPELLGPGFAIYALIDEVVDGYLSVVETLEDGADMLEDEVFSTDRGLDPREMQARIFRLKRGTVDLRRYAIPLRPGIDLLQERPQFATPALGPYLRDVMDHLIRVVELADNVRDLLTSLLEVRVAQVANRLNENMKQMTAWAGIVLVPTLIAGIYGMNFRRMPELRWAIGYPLALGFMALSALSLYVAFKRKGWL